MIRRLLCIATLLTVALLQCSLAQSLGDVARASRAERQHKGTQHAKVITNDDIVSTVSTAPATDTQSAEAAEPEDNKEADSKPASEASATPAKPKKELTQREKQELELQKRTGEINQHYLAKLANIQTQIDATKADLKKLQADQLSSSAEFHRTNGLSPSPGVYDQQQRAFNEQIVTKTQQLATLNAQLEDAREAARHAGVHVTD